MSASSLLLALQYALGVLLVVLVEARRTRSNGPDPIAMFLFIFMVQCGLPAIGLYAAVPFADRSSLTGNGAFDNILRTTDFATNELVFMLAAWFIVFFYVGQSLVSMFDQTRNGASSTAAAPSHELSVRIRPIYVLLLVGLAITLLSFVSLGDTWTQRYTNLILFRAGFASIERTAFNANAFSLTQAWSWLSILCLAALPRRKGTRAFWWLCLVMAVVFAVLGGSRRALFIPMVLAYLGYVMYSRRWRFGRVVIAAIPAVIWLAYGKAILAAIAFGGSTETVASEFSSSASAVLRASSEAGISVVESMGAITQLDLPPRLGIDHLLSGVRRLPDGMVGLDFDLPERIVRISTTALVGPDALDMPPGFMGQMWLDFRALGPVIWGLAFGIVMGIVQRLFLRSVRTRAATGAFALATFLIALPVNSGSLDFNLSVDTILLMFLLATCVKSMRLSSSASPDARVAEARRSHIVGPVHIAQVN